MRPFISIIIPVFNCEKYLKECLDSISSQKSDFEVILIDDGSTDSSPKICDEFSRTDKRFSVIHKENNGPAIARNVGLKYAKGSWITFVEADDRIESGYLDIPIARTESELIYANFSNLLGSGEILTSSFGKEEEFFTDSSQLALLRLQCFDVYSRSPYRKLGFTWGKFFKGDIIRENNILFPEGLSFYEDAIFTWAYYEHINSVCFVGEDTPHYLYRANETSLSHRADIKSIERRKKSLDYIDKKIWNEQTGNSLSRFYIESFYFALLTCSRVANNLKDLIKLVHSIYSWAPTKKILTLPIKSSEIQPLEKQLFIIKHRLAYLLAIKYYFSHGK